MTLLRIGHDRARPILLGAFLAAVDYQNARDWNRLVRLCEALALVGWGSHEPVEADVEKWVNGRFYTSLRNRAFASRFLAAGWCRKGKTFVLDADHRCYYPSPDLRARAAADTQAYAAAHPDVDQRDYGVTTLAAQRNPLPKNPLRLSRSGNYDPRFAPVVQALEALRARLDRDTRPELYGLSARYLGLLFAFSHEWSSYFHEKADIPKSFSGKPFVRPRLDIGKLTTKQGELRLVITRHVPLAFGKLPLAEQCRIFAEDILAAVDVYVERLGRKKLAVDPSFKHDVEAIVGRWRDSAKG